MAKKIIGYIVILCCFAGSIAGIYFGVRYSQVSKELKSNSEYIEQIDNLELELSQVNEYLTEANSKYSLLLAENEQNKQTIADYSVSIEEKDAKIQSLEGNISELQGQISTLENQISTLENEKQTLLSQIEDLNEEHLAEVQELESQIETLESQKIALEESYQSVNESLQNITIDRNNLLLDKQSLEEKVSANETKIAQYESQILTLQNEVTRLTGLLEGYEEIMSETYTVDFYIGDELYTTKVVRYGKIVTDLIAPTETNTYVFNYWTLDGETEVEVSTYSIEGNTIFYANYTPKYKVEFESVGVVVDTQYVVKGQTVEEAVSPTQEGYKFIGWSLDGESVIELDSFTILENVKFEAIFESELNLNGYTMAEISAISASGNAEDYFQIGDQFSVYLTTGEEVTFAVIGFNHDDLSDGSGKAGITFGMVNLLENKYSMNNSASSYGGWTESKMRNTTLVNIFNTLPEDLKSIIKPVDKLTKLGKNWENEEPDTTFIENITVTTSDRLWLFSSYEVFGKGDSSDGSTQYEYFATFEDSTIKKLSNGLGSANSWWLRSPSSTVTARFRIVSSSGVYSFNSYSSPDNNLGLCFGFCV